MKRVVICLGVVLALFAGCEEVPPFIDFSQPRKITDTSYMVSPVPAAQHKAVLIEDITGVRCVNCPNAAAKIRDIISAKTEDSVIAIALYPWPTNTNSNFGNTAPYTGFPKLANDTSTQIVEGLGIPGALPSGYVDRHIFAPQTERPLNSVGSWASFVDQRLKLPTPVNIILNKTVSGRKIGIDVKLQYTKDVAGTHKFALYLVEDKIVSRQKGPSGEMDAYLHNHALRYTFDLALGRPLNATLVAGRVFEKHYEYEIPLGYNIDNCHVICVILDSSNSDDVVNARKINLH
jgi:hypothetical protein